MDVDNVEPLPREDAPNLPKPGEIERNPRPGAVRGECERSSDLADADGVGPADRPGVGLWGQRRDLMAKTGELLAEVDDVFGDASGAGQVERGNKGDLHASESTPSIGLSNTNRSRALARRRWPHLCGAGAEYRLAELDGAGLRGPFAFRPVDAM